MTAVDRVAQIVLAVHVVQPRRRIGVFQIRHEHVRAGVERVDDHLAVHRAGDLDAAVHQIGRDGRDGPMRRANLGGFGKKIGEFAGVDFGLPSLPPRQQLLPPARRTPPPRLARNRRASGVRISACVSLTGALISIPDAPVCMPVDMSTVYLNASRKTWDSILISAGRGCRPMSIRCSGGNENTVPVFAPDNLHRGLLAS